jgi:hypothetical protein
MQLPSQPGCASLDVNKIVNRRGLSVVHALGAVGRGAFLRTGEVIEESDENISAQLATRVITGW